MIKIVNIYFEGDIPMDSELRKSTYWTFVERKVYPPIPRLKGKFFVKRYLKIIDDSKTEFDKILGSRQCEKEALRELLRIQKREKNDIEITYHYSYFYDNQCNIEFDREYMQLFAALNCNITISCARDEEEQKS